MERVYIETTITDHFAVIVMNYILLRINDLVMPEIYFYAFYQYIKYEVFSASQTLIKQ